MLLHGVQSINLPMSLSSDARIIQMISQESGFDIPPVPHIFSEDVGYVEDDGSVVGLSLCNRSLSALPRQLWELKHLRQLSHGGQSSHAYTGCYC